MTRVFVICMLLLPGVSRARVRTEWKGNVQRVEDHKYYPGITGPVHTTIYTYDLSRKQMTKFVYDSDTLQYTTKRISYYNKRDRLAKMEYYGKDGLESTVTFTYDEIDRLLSSQEIAITICRCPGDTERNISYIRYDTLGQAVAKDLNGKPEEHIYYRYDTCGQEVTIYEYSSMAGYPYICTYNDKGHMIQEVSYSIKLAREPYPVVTRYEYIYDEKGNWVKKTCLRNHRVLSYTLRTITY
ncbi:hypothetical protein GCM10023093_07980 [Nemorincola caseinilytica]|uniref:YD repeat-containing protein n=1 Tax=Nemorincola caseinilytica TaxID=2054315 RepID=A0ABP8N6B1_9BACT